MFIKAQTVIPVGTKITKCTPSNGSKAKSVYTLLRAEERKLELQAALKQRAGRFAAALKVGYSVEEALKLSHE